ncbi:MAG TPA: hypothetical protein VFJ48_01595 [Casimicrobiaceae bacterium]|nr:hypothetical protein [Casimicrobiaceae bacterium]
MSNFRTRARAAYRILRWATPFAVLLGLALDARGQQYDALGEKPESDAELPATCGRLPNGYGPYDYRTVSQDKKDLVEYAHFHTEYGAYLKGAYVVNLSNAVNAQVAAGFDYTLRAFPNHPRALKAMDDMAFRRKMEKLPSANFVVQCYFLRAIVFRPNDALVRALYGNFFARRGKAAEAREQLAMAVKLAPSDVNVRAQVASTYTQLGDWNDAESNARAAYDLGYPLPGLRDKLKSLGHWSQ